VSRKRLYAKLCGPVSPCSLFTAPSILTLVIAWDIRMRRCEPVTLIHRSSLPGRISGRVKGCMAGMAGCGDKAGGSKKTRGYIAVPPLVQIQRISWRCFPGRYALNRLYRPRPAKPAPRRSRVAGSGTGGVSPESVLIKAELPVAVAVKLNSSVKE